MPVFVAWSCCTRLIPCHLNMRCEHTLTLFLSDTPQLGHQAVNCTNGTINWKQIYGDDAFRLKRPIYESDYQALKKAKQVDLVDLEKRARQYAKVCRLSAPTM
jgi:hypothetical protein